MSRRLRAGLPRIAAALAIAGAALAAAGCGGSGGDDGGSELALGEEAVVEHTDLDSPGTPTTTLGITVLAVREGSVQELEQGGFQLDPDEKDVTPYYVDSRIENEGEEAVRKLLFLGLEDGDGNRTSATTIVSLGGAPFGKCEKRTDGTVAPGESFETCTLFLVRSGEPRRVSFLPQSAEGATDFVYWDVG